MIRYLKPIPNPTPAQIVEATCGATTDLQFNEEVWAVHYGEDGPGYAMQTTREYLLESQCWVFGEDMRADFMSTELDLIAFELFGDEPDPELNETWEWPFEPDPRLYTTNPATWPFPEIRQ